METAVFMSKLFSILIGLYDLSISVAREAILLHCLKFNFTHWSLLYSDNLLDMSAAKR